MSKITVEIYCKSKCCRCKKRKRKIIKRKKQNKLPSLRITPVVKRYFFVTPEKFDLTEEKVIPAQLFVNDYGNAVRTITNVGKQGYFNLYINGVMQEGKIYTVSSRSIKLAKTGQTILQQTPIVLEAVRITGKLVR